MKIERHDKEIVIRIPISRGKERIQSILGYLRYEELTSKIKVQPTDVDKLLTEVKKGRWQKIKKEIA